MKYKTLVLSGGGTKGILHLGAVYYLEENNLANFDTYIGTSVGSLITGLLAIGYTGKELFDFMLHFDMTTLKNFNFSNLLTGYGLDDGKVIIFVFKKLIEKKINMPEITFGQLYKKFKKKLVICATCLNEAKPYYFSYENYPDMPIYLAVRMSMAIPFIFTAVSYNGSIFSDGGLVDNYPIEQSENLSETIGIYLDGIKIYKHINNLEEFTLSIFFCLLMTTGNLEKKYNENSVYIPSSDIGVVNFSMSKLERLTLFKLGYDYCKKHVDNFKLLIDKEQSKQEDNDEKEEIKKYINKQIEEQNKNKEVDMIDDNNLEDNDHINKNKEENHNKNDNKNVEENKENEDNDDEKKDNDPKKDDKLKELLINSENDEDDDCEN